MCKFYVKRCGKHYARRWTGGEANREEKSERLWSREHPIILSLYHAPITALLSEPEKLLDWTYQHHHWLGHCVIEKETNSQTDDTNRSLDIKSTIRETSAITETIDEAITEEITEKINVLKDIEDSLGKEIIDHVQAELKSLNESLLTLYIIIAASSVLMVGGVILNLNVVKPIQELKEKLRMQK